MLVIRGAESARAAAERLAALGDAVEEEMEALLEARATDMWETARAYEPPPLPTYRRSGRLQSSWFLRRKGQGYSVGSDVPYARFVRGNASGAGQAWMHVGRWRLLADIASDTVVDLKAALVARLRARLGIGD